jgi:FixJ family two-component response regulator
MEASPVIYQRGHLMGFLYVDGHVRAYHGQRAIASKAYVARRGGAALDRRAGDVDYRIEPEDPTRSIPNPEQPPQDGAGDPISAAEVRDRPVGAPQRLHLRRAVEPEEPADSAPSVGASRGRLSRFGRALLDRSPTSQCGCILLDVQMSVLTGPQLQERLLEAGSRVPIVFLTGYGDIPTSVRTIKAGAEDFLTKPVAKLQLLETIKRAIAHGEKLRDKAEQAGVFRSLVARLTPREKEVFALLVRGLLNKQIAFELGTSVRTIKAHRHAIMQKCEVRSVAELVLIAERTEHFVSDAMRINVNMKPMHSSAPDDRLAVHHCPWDSMRMEKNKVCNTIAAARLSLSIYLGLDVNRINRNHCNS